MRPIHSGFHKADRDIPKKHPAAQPLLRQVQQHAHLGEFVQVEDVDKRRGHFLDKRLPDARAADSTLHSQVIESHHTR